MTSRYLTAIVTKCNVVVNSGLEREKDESKQKYILLSNIISVNSFFAIALPGVLWIILTDDKLIGIASILGGIILLFPIYLNAKGYTLFAKLLTVFVFNNLVIICCCLFSFNTRVQNYYFAILAASSFLFSSKERKWQYFAIVFSTFYYIIQVTSLHKYLPNYNLIKDLDKCNQILLVGSILVILMPILTFIYITHQREQQLIEEQKKLKEAQYKLEVQHADLETFSIAASHSLQTPIHVSKFFLDKIRDSLSFEVPKNLTKQLDIINNSLTQMNQLVSGLFSYNHIINIEEDYSQFNIGEELSIIKKRMEEKFPTSKILIPVINFHIVTNQMLFSIIMQNLVDNGLKYNLSAKPVIIIQLEQKEETIILKVIDNGIGIEPTNFSKIFEPFKRIDTTNKFKGNGLGLAGAKRASERIGGRLICFESSPNGSTFQLTIPNLK